MSEELVQSNIVSEENVLDRYYKAAKKVKADIIVRITSDCPFVDPLIIDEIIKTHLKNKNDLTMNNTGTSYSRGTDVEVFSFKSLEKAYLNSDKPYEKEHISPYIYEHPEIFKVEKLEAKGILKRPEFRFCVDEEDDLRVVRKVYTALSKSKKPINTYNIIKLLDSRPEIAKINAHIKQKLR